MSETRPANEHGEACHSEMDQCTAMRRAYDEAMAARKADPFEVPPRPAEADFDTLPRVPRGLLS